MMADAFFDFAIEGEMMERGFEVAVVDFFRRDAVFRMLSISMPCHAPLVISRSRLPFRACINLGAVVAGGFNVDNGVAAAAEAVETEQVLQQRLNLYAFCVLLKVVGSRLVAAILKATLGLPP